MQDQQLSDAHLLELFKNPQADLSLLTVEEQGRLVKLTEQPGPRRPVSAEDFMTPEQIANRDMTGVDVVKGFGKGAVRSAAGLMKTAASSGLPMFAGVTPESLATVDRFTPEYANPAQQLGGHMETAAELAMPVRAAAGGALRLARSAPAMVRTGAGAAFDVATGHPMRAVMRLARSAMPAADTAAASAAPAAAPAQTGGRLVRPPAASPASLEDEMAAALKEVRAELGAATPPARITTPPQPSLPPGYAPRATAPAPRAVEQLAPSAPAAAPTPAATAAPQLPASWQALVDAGAGQAPAAPARNVPGLITKITPKPGAVESARSALGAREAGNIFGMSAADVRRVAPGPSRRPLKAQMADLDADYLRRINDERGAATAGLLGALGLGTGAGVAGFSNDALKTALIAALGGGQE